jgi:hypothetical protein
MITSTVIINRNTANESNDSESGMEFRDVMTDEDFSVRK